MAEYALINSSEVMVIIVADASFISDCGNEVKTQRGYPDGSWVLTPEKCGIGWKYENAIFITPLASSTEVATGEDLYLCVQAAADGEKTYHWKRDSENVQGATSSSLHISNMQSGNTGSYTCEVGDGVHTALSSACVVTVV
jgi:hypothetical protein